MVDYWKRLTNKLIPGWKESAEKTSIAGRLGQTIVGTLMSSPDPVDVAGQHNSTMAALSSNSTSAALRPAPSPAHVGGIGENGVPPVAQGDVIADKSSIGYGVVKQFSASVGEALSGGDKSKFLYKLAQDNMTV